MRSILPAGIRYSVAATSDVELAICTTAPGTGTSTGEIGVVDAAGMSREVRGSDANTRCVRNILPETEAVESLLVAEVIAPGGNWSSHPPHGYDLDYLNVIAGPSRHWVFRNDPAHDSIVHKR